MCDTVKSFKSMGTKFRGLKRMEIFVDTFLLDFADVQFKKEVTF